jgi:DNA invertase Pin-like site-specific DNA recombinase
MRVGIYLRVSTGKQTVENQRLDLMRVAEQRGWDVVEEYVDEGISGAKGREQRPQLDRMLKDASRGKLDLIAAWALDRLGRSSLHLAQIADQLRAENVGLYFYRDSIDTSTAAGRMVYTILGAIAESERERIKERIQSGLARARKQGKHLGRPGTRVADFDKRVRELHQQGVGIAGIKRQLKVGVRRINAVLNTARREV